MQLIVDRTDQVFNQEEIKTGYLVYARHKSWPNGHTGVVTLVSDTEIQVQYDPGIRNVANHFRLPVEKVAAGEWELRWSSDLKEIGEIRMKGDSESETGGAVVSKAHNV